MDKKKTFPKNEQRLRDSIQYCHQLAHKLYQNRKLCDKKPDLLLGLEEQVDALMQARRVVSSLRELGRLTDPEDHPIVDVTLILEVIEEEIQLVKDRQDDFDEYEEE